MPFDEVVPEFNPGHNDGYARLIRAGNREGSSAPPARIEIVLERVEKKTVVETTKAIVTRAAEKVEEPTKDEAAKVESAETEVPEAEWHLRHIHITSTGADDPLDRRSLFFSSILRFASTCTSLCVLVRSPPFLSIPAAPC